MDKKWTIAVARQRFSELIRGAAREPQAIYNRDTLAAVLVSTEMFEEFLRWRDQQGSCVATAFDELRALSTQERYTLFVPDRNDRANPFVTP